MLLGQRNLLEFVINSDAETFTKINLCLAEATANAYLSALSITVTTTYFYLLDIDSLKAGETLLISAGASSVGTVTPQICKLLGQQLSTAIGGACPDEANVYYDHSAGNISEVLFDHFNSRERHVVIANARAWLNSATASAHCRLSPAPSPEPSAPV